MFESGGFDVVLGNPPWERMKLQEEEHWADDRILLRRTNKAERAEAMMSTGESKTGKESARSLVLTRRNKLHESERERLSRHSGALRLPQRRS